MPGVSDQEWLALSTIQTAEPPYCLITVRGQHCVRALLRDELCVVDLAGCIINHGDQVLPPLRPGINIWGLASGWRNMPSRGRRAFRCRLGCPALAIPVVCMAFFTQVEVRPWLKAMPLGEAQAGCERLQNRFNQHVRTMNVVKLPFAAVRLRTAAGKQYKGGSRP